MDKRLIILSDYGLDDAVATSYLIKNQEKFGIIDIVTVAGNVTAGTSFKNAVSLVTASEAYTSKTRIIPTDKIKQNFSVLPEVHGNDGMGDMLMICKMYMPVIMKYDDFLNTVDDNCTILSLGPLTVTEDILKKTENAELIIMAGTVDALPNYKGMEFNQALDPDAYNRCVKRKSVVATLDTCRDSSFNLAGHRFKEDCLFRKLVNRAIELAEKRHQDNSYIYDFIASLYITNPEIFTLEEKADKWGNTINQLKVRAGFNLAEFVKNA